MASEEHEGNEKSNKSGIIAGAVVAILLIAIIAAVIIGRNTDTDKDMDTDADTSVSAEDDGRKDTAADEGDGAAAASPATFVIVNGHNAADVGTASLLATNTPGAVILYTEPGGLPAEAEELLRETSPADVIVVGGSSSVPDSVLTEIGDASPASDVSRVSGDNRAATAAIVARMILGDPDKVGQVTLVVANGWSAPDIGAAAALAAGGGRRAVIYTGDNNELPEESAALISDYEPYLRQIVLVGGEKAISGELENRIADAVSTDKGDTRVGVSRLSGEDRIATAALVARRLLSDHQAGNDDVSLIIVDDSSTADFGVAVTLAATFGKAAVAYTDADSLSEDTADLIRDHLPAEIIIVGGSSAVSVEVEQAIAGFAPESDVWRIGGGDRAETAAHAARFVL